MNLGEKLKQARLEAGLSQRQLCGEEITRNMLSQIEHGTARPSMDTLRYLARRLEKPVSWFLEEESVVSPNQAVMTRARLFFDKGEYANAMTMLEAYRSPDDVYDRERQLMECLILLKLAEMAADEGRELLARELLERLEIPEHGYCTEELTCRALLLRGQLYREELPQICRALPDREEEFLLRAEGALTARQPEKAAQLLDACDQKSPRWKLLRAGAYMAQGAFRKAIPLLLAAEKAYPGEAAAQLEICYRETGNYRQAYVYACKQKK